VSALLVCVWVAGVLHLVVASANVFAFGKFRYLEHLQKVPVVLRQVFLVQNAYVMLVQVGLALLCLFFGRELISGRAMCRAIGGFLALFWGSRVLLQLFYYDRELRRANRVFDVLFILADGYLAVTFVLVALVTESPE
jgi:hypothetical protein